MLESLDGLKYPVEVRWLHAYGITELTPWHIITADHARGLLIEFQKETATAFHTIRDILPFAARLECDDNVGYVVVDGVVSTQVVGAHPTWRGAPEVRASHSSALLSSACTPCQF